MNWINKNKFFVIFLLFLVAITLLVNEFRVEAPLQVSFLDVGQGDAIYIKAYGKTDMLIDGGRNPQILERELFELMGSFDNSIDVLLITHPDEDHSGGLSYILNEYDVGALFISGNFSDNVVYNQILKIAEKNKIPTYLARAGTNIYLDKDKKIKFEILGPDKDVSFEEANQSSVMGRLVYGKSEFMLTGDAYVEDEEYLLKKGFNLDSDVLKLGHHGSKTSSSMNFLKAVNPEVVIVSASATNSYGHPHIEVIDRVSSLGIKILETFDMGTITFLSDGEKIYLK